MEILEVTQMIVLTARMAIEVVFLIIDLIEKLKDRQHS